MIHRIQAKNFYSIGEMVSLDFTAKDGSITMPELYLVAPFDEEVTKVAFLGGANASGKTNILRTIAFLGFILTMYSNHPQRAIPFSQHESLRGQLTEISTVFSFTERERYRYAIALTNERIFSEELYVTRFVENRVAEARVFSRTWDASNDKYQLKISEDFLPNIRQMENLEQLLSTPTNQHNTLVSTHANLDNILQRVAEYWGIMASNIMMAGAESDISLTALAQSAAANIYNAPKALQEAANSLLRRADIGFKRIIEKGMDYKGAAQYLIEHKYQDGTEITVNFPFESTGTKRILTLVDMIVRILNAPTGGVAILDEIDAFIHPDIYDDLIELFLSPATNRNGTQLIFSSHNYTTLNLLDKQQIFLTERNDSGQTEVWRLDEMKGVEARDNFYAKYMSGTYGAVPRKYRNEAN